MERSLKLALFVLLIPVVALTQGTVSRHPKDASDPITCDSTSEGATYYNTTGHAFTVCDGSGWVALGAGGGGGAPTNAQYWVGAADGTLSAEKNLGALGTGLVINTAGTPSAYAGASCTNQFPRSLNASGAATCATVSLTADVTGTLPAGNGGTGVTTTTDDNVLVANGSAWQSKAIGDCDDTGGNHLNYDTGTNAFSCGTSSSGGGGGGWTMVPKTAITTISADAVLNDDPHLQFALSASTKYNIRCEIYFDTLAAADFDWRHVFTGTSALYRMKRHGIPGSGTAFAQITVDLAASAADIGLLGTGTNGGYISISGTVHVTNAGTWSFAWAQTTSTVGNTSVHAGSYCEYRTI